MWNMPQQKKIGSTFDGHLGGFQFGVIAADTAVTTHVHISWCSWAGYMPSGVYRKSSCEICTDLSQVKCLCRAVSESGFCSVGLSLASATLCYNP